MKKQYIDPNDRAIILLTEDIITASGDLVDGNTGENIPGVSLPEDTFPIG